MRWGAEGSNSEWVTEGGEGGAGVHSRDDTARGPTWRILSVGRTNHRWGERSYISLRDRGAHGLLCQKGVRNGPVCLV